MMQRVAVSARPSSSPNLQIAVDIKLVEPKSIERSEGKAKRIIDLRKE